MIDADEDADEDDDTSSSPLSLVMRGLEDYSEQQKEVQETATRIHDEVKTDCDTNIPRAHDHIVGLEMKLQELRDKYAELEAKKATQAQELTTQSQLRDDVMAAIASREKSYEIDHVKALETVQSTQDNLDGLKQAQGEIFEVDITINWLEVPIGEKQCQQMIHLPLYYGLEICLLMTINSVWVVLISI